MDLSVKTTSSSLTSNFLQANNQHKIPVTPAEKQPSKKEVEIYSFNEAFERWANMWEFERAEVGH